MGIYVAIPTFNRRDILDRCLTCLEDQETPASLIAVCNATSTDGTQDMLAVRHPAVLSLRCTEDNWWTGTINVAVREILKRCKPDDYILCINDDVEVGRDYLANLLACVRKSPMRAAGSVSVSIDVPDIIVDGGNTLKWYELRSNRFNQGKRLCDMPRGYEQKVDVLPGRGTLYPARAFLDLGLFSDALPHYGADYEFAMRCARAGYELIVCYDAVVRSHVGMTGQHSAGKRMSFRAFKHYFTSKRSTGNVRDRFVFSRLTQRDPFRAGVLFTLSVSRNLLHYLRGI